MDVKDNANPVILRPDELVKSVGGTGDGSTSSPPPPLLNPEDPDFDEDEEDPVDASEVYNLVRQITDPEHPQLSLEQLAVVSLDQVHLFDEEDRQVSTTATIDEGSGLKAGRRGRVLLEFTPTIPHCSMATLIGLALRVRLERSLPERWKIDVRIKEGTHQSEEAVTRQLNDKERVAAALENPSLLEVVNGSLAGCTA